MVCAFRGAPGGKLLVSLASKSSSARPTLKFNNASACAGERHGICDNALTSSGVSSAKTPALRALAMLCKPAVMVGVI
jgi:hypothetical protein